MTDRLDVTPTPPPPTRLYLLSRSAEDDDGTRRYDDGVQTVVRGPILTADEMDGLERAYVNEQRAAGTQLYGSIDARRFADWLIAHKGFTLIKEWEEWFVE